MSLKTITILAVILQQFGTFTTGEKYSGMYPDVSSCFAGTNREPPGFIVDSYVKAKGNCTNGDSLEETSLCYKVCVLNHRNILKKEYLPSGQPLPQEIYDQVDFRGDYEAAYAKLDKLLHEYPQRTGYNYTHNGYSTSEIVGLYEWEEPDSVQEILKQAQERVVECDQWHYAIPKSDEQDCEDLDPKYLESMYNIVTCIEDAVKC